MIQFIAMMTIWVIATIVLVMIKIFISFEVAVLASVALVIAFKHIEE